MVMTVGALGRQHQARLRDERGESLCGEVAHEMNEQVALGLVNREKAEQVINRCFDLWS